MVNRSYLCAKTTVMIQHGLAAAAGLQQKSEEGQQRQVYS